MNGLIVAIIVGVCAVWILGCTYLVIVKQMVWTGTLGLLAVIFVGVGVGVVSETQEKSNHDVNLSECTVIGNAVDRGHTAIFWRQIYKCKDGMIYIR